MNKFTLGADPELFVLKGKSLLTSQEIELPGTKETPYPLGEKTFVQRDNAAVEFNIFPAENVNQFVSSISTALNELKSFCENRKFGEKLAIIPYGSFSKQQLDHPETQRVGCDPDFNAWTGKPNPSPDISESLIRVAGGHIHVGVNGLPRRKLVKAMDLFLGCPSILFDKDEVRRKLYGQAGCYRPKPYGVEYRVLSNFWIEKDHLVEWVWNQTSKAVEFVQKERDLEHHALEIQQCINTFDKAILDNLNRVYSIYA